MKKLIYALMIVFIMSAVCEAMTLRGKVGQLFLIRPDQLDPTQTLEQVHNDKRDAKGVKSVKPLMLETLKDYPAGGFILFRKNIDSPSQLRKLTQALKTASTITPIMAVDEEGGLIARIANHKAFNVKKYASAKAMADSGQVRKAAAYIASYLKDYGFNMNFAPVADINTNPENIVIGDRAFGDNPALVSRLVGEYLDGLHSQGIAGSIKHFPGHGDTKGDTHTGYVEVTKTWDELLQAEIIPFRDNLKKADSVMIAHITMKNVTHDNLPATLSRELVTGKLRNELGYDGVVIADALMMKAISNHYTSAEAAILALEAGCDILLMPWDYREAFDGIVEAVKSGRISEARIDESIKRITKLKERLTMPKWWQTGAVYQVYPKSFQDTAGTGTGDIRGIISRLDYLAKLGVNAVWMTPVYPSPMIDNGYDISDYSGINPDFGTMSDFEELVSEAGKKGIKIVMDLVYNHSSNKHAWFLESKSSRDNPKADWYIWRDPKPDGTPPTNWRSIFGGSAWTYCEERGQYYLHTFAVEQPDLNWENPDVRRALYDSARFWLDKGVGGFRIDAITYIKKPAEFLDGTPDSKEGTVNVHTMTANQPGILDFLHEFKREVVDGRDIFTVGEANGVSPDELPLWVGKDGVFDMLFEFSHVTLPFGDAEIWCYPEEWTLTDLKRAISASQKATANNGWYPAFFENHDQPRSVNHFLPEGADPKKAAKVLGAVLLTMRGTPFIYQGQELGMTNRFWRDIDEINDVQTKGQYDLALKEGFTSEEAMKFIRYFTRDNARTPMQWTSGKNAGFTSGTPWLPVNENYTLINAESEEKDSDSVLNWYRKLLAFRKSSDVLIRGSWREVMSESEEVFGFVRELEGREVITLANFSDKAVKIPEELVKRRMLLSSEREIDSSELSPLEARIYE
ncbi:MAG: alpha,alpha-phosphotrehalase [Synergistaceae bacterium]|nr:alpha,alpha-phosphotrehalase [Synergistaceae bacterium]